jgi:hypothetical protein
MFELTINGKVYPFNFGMGFMREINRKVGVPVDGLPNVKKNIGLRYHVAGIIDGDLESLVEVLDAANKNLNPRVQAADLDAYIDDANTDIDALFAEVLDFLSNANATKKTVAEIRENIKKQTEQNGVK